MVPSSCLIKESEKKITHPPEFCFQALVEPNEAGSQPFTKRSLMFLKTAVCKKKKRPDIPESQ